MTRVAVIGHVEWVDFVRLEDYPPRGGLAQATRIDEHAAGGAVVAASVLAALGAEVEFFCALGHDERARRAERELTARGVTVHAARRAQPSRFVFTMLDEGGERTIVTVGERLQPSGRARAARTLVVTPRAGDHDAGLSAAPEVDATVFSTHDGDEQRWAEDWEAHSRLMVATDGAHGGRWWGESSGRWSAARVPGPIRDSYGCGDSFAAGLTFGLASGHDVADAAAIGARCGAEMLTRVGAP